MSFTDSAAEVLNRAEVSLSSLITDALKAKAYRQAVAIAGMAESVAAIGSGRAPEGRKVSTAPPVGGTPTADTAKASEPAWMRPKAT